MEIRVDYQALDGASQTLISAVSDVPYVAQGMKSTVNSAASASQHYNSRLDESLQLFAERWTREMDFVAQDLSAASSNLTRAGDAFKTLDDRIASEMRVA